MASVSNGATRQRLLRAVRRAGFAAEITSRGHVRVYLDGGRSIVVGPAHDLRGLRNARAELKRVGCDVRLW